MKKIIGYLGPEGSNSHEAAEAVSRDGETLFPLSQFELGTAMREGNVGTVILPVENSIEGRVKWVLDMLAQNNIGRFSIVGEFVLKVRHCLIGFGTEAEVETIYSIAPALGQCRTAIGRTLTRTLDSTSAAVKLMADMEDKSSAAIGTARAAKIYGVPIIKENVGDNPNNETRFLILGQETHGSTGNDKTSIVFETEHKPGALCDVLSILKVAKINMTMIFSEASPEQVRGKYIFFVDFDGHQDDKRQSVALDLIREEVKFLKVLGSYPKAGR